MVRRWMGVALVAAGLALGSAVRAQAPPTPVPVGAGQMPAPLPVAPCGPAAGQAPQREMIPGPLNPQIAPMGPPDPLSLSADHPSAFQCENCAPDEGVYLHLGARFLQRQRLGAGGVAVRDPGMPPLITEPTVVSQVVQQFPNVNALLDALPRQLRDIIRADAAAANLPLTGNPNVLIQQLITQVPRNTGIAPPPGAPVAQQFNNLVPRMQPGFTGTIGYMYDNQAWEYTSFFALNSSRSVTYAAARGVDVMFYNPPPGFSNFTTGVPLFLQADRVTTTFGSSIASHEFNYRWWNSGLRGFDLILGVRYVDHHDELAIYTDHGATDLTPTGVAEPTTSATYAVSTRNQIVAPQMGCEWSMGLTRYFTLGIEGKAALGVDFAKSEVSLVRGDGFLGFDSHMDHTQFSQIYEIGAFAEFNVLQRLRVRGGYNALWLVDVMAAPDQVDYNLRGNVNYSPPPPTINPPNFNNANANLNTVQSFLQTALGQSGMLTAAQRAALDAELRKQTQSIPHGRNNTSGSILYHGPMVQFEFLF